MRTLAGLMCGALLLGASTARAAGFEKVVPWSGRYSGIANAATGLAEGGQALYFNPAGLVAAEDQSFGRNQGRMFDLSLNFSPTLSQFSGPTSSYLNPSTSVVGFSPLASIFGSWRPLPGLGLGAGAYVSAGLNSKYENVDYSGLNPNFDTLRPELESKLDIIEASIGAAYEILDGLRVGGSWRMSHASAKLSSAVPVPPPAGAPAGTPPVALVAVTLDDLTAWDFTGFRVGLQYAPKWAPWWGAGIMWRTPVNFDLEGDTTSQIEGGVGPNGPSAQLAPGNVAVSAQLPSAIAAGAWLSLFDHTVRLAAEYTFTHYRVVDSLDFDGTLQTPGGPTPVPPLVLDWDNQHVGRFGVEVSAWELGALRLGYAIVSQVTATNRARATLASPGLGHSFNVGAGQAWKNGLRVDAGFEYTFANGRGTNELGIPGLFESNGYALHTGASWSF